MLDTFNKHEAGFTLVEILVTMALLMLVMVPMYSVFESSNRTYAIQNEVTAAENNLRAGMGMLNYDLKSVGYDPTGSGHFGITAATSTTITFTRDDNANGSVDAGETVAYTFSGSQLLRGGGIVAENVQGLEYYYNNATTAPTDLSSIRNITVSMLAVTEHADQKFANQSFTTASGVTWTTPTGFRGKFMTQFVKCRNMGL